MSWLAVKGCDRQTALEDLGLDLTGQEDDDPIGFLSVGDLPGGWLLFVAMRDLYLLFKPKFAALSRRGPAVGCAIEEHVMVQEARGFEDGAERWRVTHNSENGIYDIEVHGDPPAALAAIRERLVAQQDAEGGEDAPADYISDVPLELAKSICGFKHDDAWPAGLIFAEVAVARRSASPAGPGFFARLFGRR